MQLTSTQISDQLSFWNKWHRTRGATGQDAVHRESRAIFLQRLKPTGRRLDLLDLGCGEGHDTSAFVQAGHRAYGIDFSPVAVKKARRALPWWRWRKRGRLHLQVHDIARELPFQDASFDGVFSHLALHYFHDDVTHEIFSEVARVTRPGGTFVFSVKSTQDPYFGTGDRVDEFLFCRKGHLRHFFTIDQVQALLVDWKIDQIQPYEGNYASPEHSAFIRAVAHKPQ